MKGSLRRLKARRVLARRIASFPRWHYEFDLDGLRTPVADPSKANRHRQRERYFFQALLRECGGSLEGHRILDLGCNAGYWALCSLRARCDFVLGVDAREMHVRQAELVLEVERAARQRWQIVRSDVFELDLDRWSQFDIVLCLGLLYHVAQPIELMRLMASTGASMILIDTSLSSLPGSAFEVHHESLEDPRNAIDRELVLVPTRQAVIDLAGSFDFRVEVLEPSMDDWAGCEDYRSERRRAFICRRIETVPSVAVEATGTARSDPASGQRGA